MFKYEDYVKSANFIKEKIGDKQPKIAIVLGSGLGVLKEEIKNRVVIDYKDIPNFPVSTVKCHAGELIIGTLSGKDIIAMNGRFHYYEGYNLQEVTFPIRVFKLLGIETLILTNAAGGINLEFNQGDLMVIKDYISFFSESALISPNILQFGERFPDMSNTFNKSLRKQLLNIIYNNTGVAREGVYAYMKGPNYETPSEIKALGILGADAVGMSTVPEAIVAHHCKIKTVAVSCITNMAAGVLDRKLSHKEVMETSERIKDKFIKIIKEFVEEL